ncbi:MAG: flagellar biosynthesis anti-sigma factor FlgM [Gammaproteobacteria bacterium]|jgi:flagellar biosynthesis anti-sigma factor FlgM
MNMKINGVDVRPTTGFTPVAPSRVKASDAGVQGSGNGVREFEVSQTARQLADLEARVAQSSGINEAKVEAIRLALERGEYQIDTKKIADQLMKLDWEIGKASGRI